MQKLIALLKSFLLITGTLFVIVSIILYFDRLEPADPDVDATEASGIPDTLQRKTILSELARFKKAIQSNDREELASFFAFPIIADSLQAVPYIDSSLLKDLEARGGIIQKDTLTGTWNSPFLDHFYVDDSMVVDTPRLTSSTGEDSIFTGDPHLTKAISKSQFLKYHDRIFDPYKDGALFKKLFEAIDLNGLLGRNLLKTEVRAANKHCNYFFGIGVRDGDYINIDYGIGERPGLLAAFHRTYGIETDECRGNAYTWIFRLVHNRLHFVKEEDVYGSP